MLGIIRCVRGEVMKGTLNRRSAAAAIGLTMLSSVAIAAGQRTPSIDRSSKFDDTYSSLEIDDAGHKFFGKAARALGEADEYGFHSECRPIACSLGAAGAGR